MARPFRSGGKSAVNSANEVSSGPCCFVFCRWGWRVSAERRGRPGGERRAAPRHLRVTHQIHAVLAMPAYPFSAVEQDRQDRLRRARVVDDLPREKDAPALGRARACCDVDCRAARLLLLLLLLLRLV